jgi:hypothetical protein
MRCPATLRKTIYAMPIVILTMASAQTDMQELQDIKGGQNSSRTELQKKNDRDIDRAYPIDDEKGSERRKKEL